MGLGSQMHHCVWLVFAENTIQFGSVANINMLEGVALAVADFSQGFEVAGIGQLVEIDCRISRAADDVTNHCRTDETGSTGYENFHLLDILNFCSSQRHTQTRRTRGDRS